MPEPVIPDGFFDPATTWVTSDTHFGHDNIVKYSHRPMNHGAVMRDHWETVVPAGAKVLHLGDLVFKSREIPVLPGDKYLIRGNHDGLSATKYEAAGFQVIAPFTLVYRGATVHFNHYPIDDGDYLDDAEYVVHGHIHNNGYLFDQRQPLRNVPYLRNHINLSTELTKYTPVNMRDLLDAAIFGEVRT